MEASIGSAKRAKHSSFSTMFNMFNAEIAIKDYITAFFDGPDYRVNFDGISETDSTMYDLGQAFNGTEAYWKDEVRTERFKHTMTQKQLLYRPTICEKLEEMVASNLTKPVREGTFVTGPNGVGKSHTLVNLVLKLMSTGNYLVTFLPNCDQWGNAQYLVDMICLSFGALPAAIGMPSVNNKIDDNEIRTLINAVDTILKEKNKQWVFVFDEVNELFRKEENESIRSACSFLFPFYFIELVMKPGRITSVISASSDNEMTFEEYEPEDFAAYAHPLDMSLGELKLVFPALNDKNQEYLENMKLLTGCVPWQTQLFLELNEVEYWNAQLAKVEFLTNIFYDKSTNGGRDSYWYPYYRHDDEGDDYEGDIGNIFYDKSIDDVREQLRISSMSCLLNTFEKVRRYDKKFVVLVERNERNEKRFTCAFPAVKQLLLDKYWNSFVKYSSDKESRKLDMCRTGDLPNSIKGQFFESIIINRCRYYSAILSAEGSNIPLPGCALPWNDEPLPSMFLPEQIKSDGVYIPENRNFPAIDMIWKRGDEVWGVQIHIGRIHKSSLKQFKDLCVHANWNNTFKQVYLLYLCPTPELKMIDLADVEMMAASDWSPTVLEASAGEIKGLSHTGEVNIFEGIEWKLRSKIVY